MNFSPKHRRQNPRNIGRDKDRVDVTDQQTDTGNEHHPCLPLAIVGSLFSIALSVLLFVGTHSAGRVSDLFPCLIAIFSAWAFASIMGRLSGHWLNIAVFLTTTGSIALGKYLIAFEREPRLTIWQLVWESNTSHNLVLCLLAPIVAVALTVGSRSLTGWALSSDKVSPSGMKSTHARVPWWVVTWVASVLLIYALGGMGDRTGFRMITVPYDELSANQSLLGFSVSMENRPTMVETISAIEQVTWFAGGVRSDNNFRFLRSGYAFLAAQVSPICSPRNSLIVVNFVSWLVCLAVLWRLALQWYSSTVAASICVCVGAVGLGFGVHINDTTPHLLSYAMYFFGIAMISNYHLSSQNQSWRVHLLFGLIFGSMSLAYNVAQMLLLVYLAVAIRRQRLDHLLAATSITLLFRPTLRWILPGLGINVKEVEGEYLSRAIGLWRESFDTGWIHFLRDIFRYTAEIVTSFESPWILILGLLGLMINHNRQRLWLCFMAIASPVGACLVFAPAATARGYVVFGASVIVYLGVGSLFRSLIERSGRQRVVAWLLLAVLCAGQLAWTTSHYHGWAAPAKAFFLGWDQGAPLLTTSPVLMNATGNEPLPKVFGGDATFLAGGAVETPLTRNVFPRWMLLALLSRLPFVAAILLVTNAYLNRRTSRRWASGLIVSWFMFSSLISFAVVDQQPYVFDCMNAIELVEDETMVYEVDVSENVNQKMQTLMTSYPDASIELFLGASGPVDVLWEADDVGVTMAEADSGMRHVHSEKGKDQLSRSRHWRFSLSNSSGNSMSLAGWQRTGLLGRRLKSDGDAKSTLPGVEVRIRDPASGILLLVVF